MMEENRFVIRVYGIVINDANEVLLSDEYVMGMRMTKFPGGGLNYGEGPIDCIKREAIEEFGQPVEILEHFYTTDFFQETMFFKGYQLLCIYYKIKFTDKVKFKISEIPFDFEDAKEGSQSFRWVKIDALTTEMITFPIDKIVVEKLQDIYK